MELHDLSTTYSRSINACYMLTIAYSSTALSLFAATLPDILAYRVPHVHWTGRWVEIPAIIVLGVCCLTNFISLWIRGYLMRPRNAIGIQSTFLGLCVWVLVLTSSAGPSRLWRESIDGVGGSSSDSGSHTSANHLDCNTLARSGPDCNLKSLKKMSALQISAITFLSLTLLMEIVLLVFCYRACSDELTQKWRKRMERMRAYKLGTRDPDGAGSTKDDFQFTNQIPKTGRDYV